MKNGFPIPAPVYHTARIILGAIFIVASYDKLSMPWMFGRAVLEYEILVGPLAYLISFVVIILPALELVTGILLIINRLVRPAALLMLILNVLFIILIFSAMARGLEIECGCGLDEGPIATLAGTQADWGAIIRDLVFVMLNLVVLLSPYSKNK